MIELQGRLCNYIALMKSDDFDGSILLLLILTQHTTFFSPQSKIGPRSNRLVVLWKMAVLYSKKNFCDQAKFV